MLSESLAKKLCAFMEFLPEIPAVLLLVGCLLLLGCEFTQVILLCRVQEGQGIILLGLSPWMWAEVLARLVSSFSENGALIPGNS
jgi:hypothetical protein